MLLLRSRYFMNFKNIPHGDYISNFALLAFLFFKHLCHPYLYVTVVTSKSHMPVTQKHNLM